MLTELELRWRSEGWRRARLDFIEIRGGAGGALLFGGLGGIGVEMKMLLHLRVKVFQFRVADAVGVKKMDVRGGDGGDGDVAINLAADFERGEFFIGAVRGQHQGRQSKGGNKFG